MDMNRRTLLAGTAIGTAGAVVLAACGADDSGSGSDGSDAAGGSGIVTLDSTEPVQPLLPTDTTEAGGGKPMLDLYSCLVYYDKDGEPHNEVAESIESEDNVTWTIKLKDGWTFTNGEKVTANSFVNAWNFGANVNNAQIAAYFFDPIVGYTDVSADGAAADATMSGLKVVDDLTFTAELVSAQSDFSLRLGYNAYAPMPDAAFDDIDAYGENPIGNGPYKLDGDGAWEHNTSISLVVNDDYQGERKAKNGGIQYVIYQDKDTAYNDLQSGQLDLCSIPPSALTTFEDDLGDRAVNQPGSVLHFLSIFVDQDRFTGEAGKYRRAALSRAIDRESIAKAIFNDTVSPAKDFTSPVLSTYTEDIEGNDVLTYDEEEAKSLWAKAEAIEPFGDEPFKIAYNADGTAKPWIDAIANSLSNVLGITAQGETTPDFKSLKEKEASHDLTGGFRSSWIPDYPSAFNYLASLYASGAADGNGANATGYKNPDFDDLLAKAQASSADDTEGISKLYQEAQAILMEDLPGIPLWVENATAGFSEEVSDVIYGWDGYCELYNVAK